MPKVSVIVPFYNVSRYVSDCLDRLCAQTLDDIEIICVDDGSSDGTEGMLDEYAKRDARVRVFHRENGGAGSARNFGLKVASGEYLSILDSDDIYDKNMLEIAYSKAEIYQADVVLYGSNQYLQKEGRYQATPWSVKRPQIPAKEVFRFEDMLPNRFVAIQGWTWDKLFRADFVKVCGFEFQEQRIYNDMFFTYATCLLARRMTFIDKTMIHQRKRGGGSLSDNSSPYWQCLFDALMAVRDVVYGEGMSPCLKEDFREYVLRMATRQLSLCSEEDAKAMRIQIEKKWCGVFGGLESLLSSER